MAAPQTTAGPHAADPLLDVTALSAWAGDRLGDPDAPLQVSRLGAKTGIGNALFELRRGEQVFVLRRPPAVLNDKSAGNMVREWRILTALEGTTSPIPLPGCSAMTRRSSGRPSSSWTRWTASLPASNSPSPSTPTTGSDAAWPRRTWMPWSSWRRSTGAPGAWPTWASPTASSSARCRGGSPSSTATAPGTSPSSTSSQTGWSETGRRGSAGHHSRRLQPVQRHGRPGAPARLAAIIDWDTGTIGDPLLDIGHLLARWTDPGEEPVLGEQAGGLEGYPTRAELAARYAERSGSDLSALPYYECTGAVQARRDPRGHLRPDRGPRRPREGQHDGLPGAQAHRRGSRVRARAPELT